MKQLNYILLLALTFSFWGCQDALGPQLQDVSKVKTETKWRVSSVNDSKISKVSYRLFNENADVLSIINFNEDGSKKSSSEFEFKNSKKTEIEVQYSNGDTIGIFIHDFELENGKVVRKTTLDNQGHIVNSEQFVYDLNGNVKERLLCESDENCENKIIYNNEYIDGSLTIRYTYDDAGEISQKDSIVYSSDHSYFEKITTDKAGNVYYSTGYNIDNNGHITSEIIKNNKGQIIDKFIYEFTYFD